MTDTNREHLSCLMDGELDRGACRFLIRRIGDDDGMRSTWHRFHLVRACLHRDRPVAENLAARVAATLREESAPVAGGSLPGWLKPVAGSAIAASVALVAIVGINSSLMERSPEPGNAEPGFVSQSTSLDQEFVRSPEPVNFSESSRAERQRIDSYVVRHHQATGGAGFIKLMPVVTNLPERTGGDNGQASRDDARRENQ